MSRFSWFFLFLPKICGVPTCSALVIADFAKRVEKETGVESREAILGHVQRGGAPSAKDRVVATEMGNYCVNLLKNGISNRVVVMKNTDIIDLDILEALKMEKPFDLKRYEMANMINI